MFPIYSRAERAADAVVHLAGVFFGLIGGCALIVTSLERLPVSEVAGVSVYSAGLVGMFSASAGYNLTTNYSLKEWLRRLDHAGIYMMIAGSYTPFALRMGGQTGMILLAAVWFIALLGTTLKLFFPRRLERLSLAFYLAQGWCVLFAMGALVDAVPTSSVTLLLIGGCIYSAGVIFHLLERMPFHNVIWHLFVLGGAVVQYASIYVTVVV